jgi:hypothetical protein
MAECAYRLRRVEDILLESSELKLPRRFKEILTREIGRERNRSFWLRDRGDYLANDCYAHFELELAKYENMSEAKFTTCVQHHIKDWLAQKENKLSRALATGYDEENKVTYVGIDDVLGTESQEEIDFLTGAQDRDTPIDYDDFFEWCKLTHYDSCVEVYMQTDEVAEAAKRLGLSRETLRDRLERAKEKYAKMLKEKEGGVA